MPCRIGQIETCKKRGCQFKRYGLNCNSPLFSTAKLRQECSSLFVVNAVKGIRKKVYDRDGWRCLKCGTDANLTLDEIVPRSKGGKRNFYNCQTLCKDCNGKKGSQIIDYRSKQT